MRRWLMALSILGLLVAGCTSDPTTSQEYQTLQQQLTDAQQQLADVQQQLADAVAERDAPASAAPSSARHDRAKATQEAILAILADPESFGTEQEVVDALASYATPDARMDDIVFGGVGMRSGWYNTLYGSMRESRFDNIYTWLSEDGSHGGGVWLWHGTNTAGNPFELAGVNLDDFNEEGLLTNTLTVYPYPADYVRMAITGAGT